ncbi:MAG: hypothetical protein M3Q07_13790 [Pseudobdellovibrionaceae bacterium]|nr:hypothetical protein [Pseudobdellovibrionaceae bacterium]
MEDRAKANFRARKSYWKKKGFTDQELFELARNPKPRASSLVIIKDVVESNAKASEIPHEVEKLKSAGLITDILGRHEILPIREPDEFMPLVTFNPSQPVIVPDPTQAEGWKPAETMPVDSLLGVDWLRLIVCGIGALICTLALITYGAKAGGNTPEAKFWSCLIVISGSILLALPFRWYLLRSWLHKALGLSLVSISYTTMHTSIENAEQRTVLITLAGSTELQQLEKRISDIEAQLAPTRGAIARLDPVKYRSMILRMQTDAKPLEVDLAAARDALVSAQNKSIPKASSETADRWGLVQWLRQLMLEPLNILCLHGFLECLHALKIFLQRKAAKALVAGHTGILIGNLKEN